MIKPSIAILAAFLVFMVPSFAETTLPVEGGSFLAVSPTTLAAHTRLSDADKSLVSNYIISQIATNNISIEQFRGLTSDQQRVVLVPGHAFTLTREMKRTVVPNRTAVPVTITKSIAVNKAIPNDVIDMYGIDLPASITAELPALPTGFQRMIIGSHLVVLDANNIVMDATELSI
jgi:hypothetical protein